MNYLDYQQDIIRRRQIQSTLDHKEAWDLLTQMWDEVNDAFLEMGFPCIDNPLFSTDTVCQIIDLRSINWKKYERADFEDLLESPYITGCDHEALCLEVTRETTMPNGVRLRAYRRAYVALPPEYVASLHAAGLIEWHTNEATSYQSLTCGGF